jgi:excinuclease ABC subunit C
MTAAKKNRVLSDKLDHLPLSPGVYLFRDRRKKVIYVGKAKILRHRVRSYFTQGEDGRYQYQRLVNAIADLDTIVTDSEMEALILEANLIKQYSPRFNVRLRDDKSYPYVRITRELFPRVFITRKTPRDGSKYLGPYTDVKTLRRFMRTFKGLLHIRHCNRSITPEAIHSRRYRPCLNYHIGRCAGACSGKIAPETYQRNVRHLVNLLQGKDQDLLSELREKMNRASSELQYEEAAQWRDRLQQVEAFHKQSRVSGLEAADLFDRDVIAVAAEDEDACAALFQIRSGRIIGRSHFYLNNVFEKTPAEIIEAFLKEYYTRTESLPEEIFLPFEIEGIEVLEEWLTDRRGKKVRIFSPKIGEKARLIRLVQRNAELLLGELKLQKSKREFVHHALKALQRDLKLKKPPKRIEAFDISNIHGTDAVASMVCFKDAKPARSQYRRYRIKTVTGSDDFAMMEETIRRRYRRVLTEKTALPDLILVDGGKGQLNRAVQVLNELGLSGIPVIGLAKKLEEVFLPGVSEPQNIPKNSSGLKLICHVRDEAHRFAVTYHRTLRKKRAFAGELDRIRGIGLQRKRALLKYFGSLKKLKEADADQIAQVPGISKALAREIHRVLSVQSKTPSHR